MTGWQSIAGHYARRLAAAEAKLDAIGAVHYAAEFVPIDRHSRKVMARTFGVMPGEQFCAHCAHVWPCPTSLIVNSTAGA